MRTCYAAIDGEYDGTNPLEHSMRAIAIVIFDADAAKTEPMTSIYRTITPREGTSPKPETMRDFWNKKPEQWKEVNTNCVSPEQAMSDIANFLNDVATTHRIYFIAKPAAQDWMFFKCYYDKFAPKGSYNIGYQCIDIMPCIEQYCLDHGIANPKRLYMELCQGLPYTHCALVDATCQGHAFVEFKRRLKPKYTY